MLNCCSNFSISMVSLSTSSLSIISAIFTDVSFSFKNYIAKTFTNCKQIQFNTDSVFEIAAQTKTSQSQTNREKGSDSNRDVTKP